MAPLGSLQRQAQQTEKQKSFAKSSKVREQYHLLEATLARFDSALDKFLFKVSD